MQIEDTNKFIEVLHDGVVPATGCTEPIAVALGAANCMKYLSTKRIDQITANVSLNILKNATAVMVPGTGEAGLKVAAATGALIGDPNAGLKVIAGIKAEDVSDILKLAHSDKIEINLAQVPDDLYVDVEVKSGADHVKVWIAGNHTNIFKITKNDVTIFEKNRPEAHAKSPLKDFLQTKSLLEVWQFATNVSLKEIEFMQQAKTLNLALAQAGLTEAYGIRLGQSLYKGSRELDNQILAYTAAASDARMGGATLAAMSNSGSGNQGITATVPVCVTAKALQVSDEQLTRALTLSNLTALYIHAFLPVLSAFCATDSAAMGAAVGIVYLKTNDYQMATKAVNNMAGDAAGMVCDGAGCSCAMKVATSVSSMLRSVNLALQGIVIPASNGLVCADVDQTIRDIGRLGSEGLKRTDPVVLDIMLNKK